MLIDRSLLQRRIYAGKNVAPVAIAEILHIGAREVFTLTEAAARIGQENEVAVSGKSYGKTMRSRPRGPRHGSRTTMHTDNHGIFFCRIEVARIKQPALQIESFIRPMNALCFAPRRLEICIAVGDLFPVADGASPDFRRMGQ